VYCYTQNSHRSPSPTEKNPSMKAQIPKLALTASLLIASLAGCTAGGSGAPTLTDSAEAAAPVAAGTEASFSDKLDTAKEAARKAMQAASDKIGALKDAAPAAPSSPGVAAPESLAALKSLPIKGRAPKTGYTRVQFGAAWKDVDRNGCDTRNDLLKRDLTGETFKPGTKDCVVLTGTLADNYTGKTINFTRGADSSAVQIDHRIALSNAWQTGAQQLSKEQREALANDPLNLEAADGPANMQKGDGDTATWLPANKSYRCTYVSNQIAVKAKYKLWVTQAEHDAMAGVLAGCPAN
jgi:hypothetical protein